MQVAPYLFFDGHAEEAIGYYAETLGADVVMMMRFKDAPPSEGRSPVPMPPPDKIMHAALKLGSQEILISDGMCTDGMKPIFSGFSLTLSTPDDATTRRLFDALAKDGQVRQPLMPTFFSSQFGMLEDKFGVGWILLTTMPMA